MEIFPILLFLVYLSIIFMLFMVMVVVNCILLFLRRGGGFERQVLDLFDYFRLVSLRLLAVSFAPGDSQLFHFYVLCYSFILL